MISNDFTEENKDILKSVEQNYSNHCNISFINMTYIYNEQKTSTKSKYYRLSIHDKLPNIDKIIYLDGDTMIFEDLTELINLDMKEYFILGFLDNLYWALREYSIKNAIVLNSGVLLMNLKSLRINNITDKFISFMRSQNNSVAQEDQTVINYVLQKNISTLPPKYGMWAFSNNFEAYKHNEVQNKKYRYNKNEYLKAYKNPAILHYTGSKPFRDKDAIFYSLWWDYAKKTKYYKDIIKYSNNAK